MRNKNLLLLDILIKDTPLAKGNYFLLKWEETVDGMTQLAKLIKKSCNWILKLAGHFVSTEMAVIITVAALALLFML